MAWFTAGEVDNAFTTATRIAIVGSATGTSSAFAQYEAWARGDVKSAAENAGYSLSDTTSNATVKRLAIAAWYSMAAGARKGLPIPERIKEDLYRLEQLREGNYRIPGLNPSERDGIGGVKFSSVSSSSSNGRMQVFSRKKLRYSW